MPGEQVRYLFEDILQGDAACVGLDVARPSHLVFNKELHPNGEMILASDDMTARHDTSRSCVD